MTDRMATLIQIRDTLIEAGHGVEIEGGGASIECVAMTFIVDGSERYLAIGIDDDGAIVFDVTTMDAAEHLGGGVLDMETLVSQVAGIVGESA